MFRRVDQNEMLQNGVEESIPRAHTPQAAPVAVGTIRKATKIQLRQEEYCAAQKNLPYSTPPICRDSIPTSP